MCVCAFSWCVVSENQDSSLRECVCVCAFCGVWQSKGMCACVPLWRVVSESNQAVLGMRVWLWGEVEVHRIAWFRPTQCKFPGVGDFAKTKRTESFETQSTNTPAETETTEKNRNLNNHFFRFSVGWRSGP